MWLLIHVSKRGPRWQCVKEAVRCNIPGACYGMPHSKRQVEYRALFQYKDHLSRYRDFHCKDKIDEFVQERHNSCALAMDLHVSCTHLNPSRWLWDCLISVVGSISVRWYRYIEMAPRLWEEVTEMSSNSKIMTADTPKRRGTNPSAVVWNAVMLIVKYSMWQRSMSSSSWWPLSCLL